MYIIAKDKTLKKADRLLYFKLTTSLSEGEFENNESSVSVSPEGKLTPIKNTYNFSFLPTLINL